MSFTGVSWSNAALSRGSSAAVGCGLELNAERGAKLNDDDNDRVHGPYFNATGALPNNPASRSVANLIRASRPYPIVATGVAL